MARIGIILFIVALGLPLLAAPQGDTLLTSEAGPYLICIASFRGDDSKDLAQRLVSELRTDYKLKAYIYDRFTEEQQKQTKELERLRQMYGESQKFRKVRIPEEYAVLVGDFRDQDSARKELERIRKQPAPKKVEVGFNIIGIQKANAVRDNDLSKVSGQYAKHNLFVTAFVSRNPLLPVEPKKPEQFDPILHDLNRGEPHSLLKTKNRYSLVVKVFHGASAYSGLRKESVFSKSTQPSGLTSDPKLAKQLEAITRQVGWNLDAAAIQAHSLCDGLRHPAMGYESYVLHTRYNSMVTVGSFNDPKSPEVEKLTKALAGLSIGPVTKLMDAPQLIEIPRE